MLRVGTEFKGTVVAMTHDRYFLDNVAGFILEVAPLRVHSCMSLQCGNVIRSFYRVQGHKALTHDSYFLNKVAGCALAVAPLTVAFRHGVAVL